MTSLSVDLPTSDVLMSITPCDCGLRPFCQNDSCSSRSASYLPTPIVLTTSVGLAVHSAQANAPASSSKQTSQQAVPVAGVTSVSPTNVLITKEAGEELDELEENNEHSSAEKRARD